MNNPNISIIILNWNGWEDTIECLESFYNITYHNYSIVLVDNGSKDESIKKIREYLKGKKEVNSKFFKYNPDNKPIKWIEYTKEESEHGGREKEIINVDSNQKLIIIKNDKNYGFTEGNNIAMRYVLKFLKSDYVLLLNNDTAVDKNFLTELVKVGESKKNIGIVSPIIHYYDFEGEKNVVHFAGGIFNPHIYKFDKVGINTIDKGQFNKIKEIDWAHGACMLIKSKMLKDIGLLDSDFFSYWEENEFSLRAKKKGYKIYFTYKSNIYHKVGGLNRHIKSWYLYGRNCFLLLKKHADLKHLVLFFIYFISIDIWTTGLSLLFKYKSKNSFVYYMKGVFDGFRILANNPHERL